MARMLCSRLNAGLAIAVSLTAVAIAPAQVDAKVYFSAFLAEGGVGIERSGFDGSQAETLQLQPTGFDDGVAVDVRDGAMYWTDTNASVIWRANLNGTNAQIVVDDFGWEPLGIALDLANGKMYWNDSEGIKRANLEGGGQELLTKGSAGGFIALDLVAQRMYWVSAGAIKSAAMKANPTVTDLVTGQAGSFGLAVDHGGRELYWLALNSKKKLVLIRRSNLDGSEVETIVERPGEGLEGGLAIDPTAGKLYWTEPEAHKIAIANLDGSGAKTLFSTGLDNPVDVAVETVNPHPTNTLAPVIEGRPQVGSALSCNAGAWSGTGAISLAYRWLLAGSPIEGVTGPLYTPPLDQAGSTLACEVTATDDVETSTATSAAVGLAALPSESPPVVQARLIAGIAVARLTSSGSRARVPVFTSLACSATLTAQPMRRRRSPRAHAALGPPTPRRGKSHARSRKPTARTISVTKSLPPGRSTMTIRGLVPGTTYRLTLSVTSADGQSAKDQATLHVTYR
jgi:Low-density lipoprotein receptor repeat class B